MLANVRLSVTSSNYVSAHLSEAAVRHAPLSSMSNERSGRNVDRSGRGAARRGGREDFVAGSESTGVISQ